MSTTDNFYLQKEEPDKSCLLALREIILSLDKDISTTLKYGMPCFCYKGKMFCHLWVHKKHRLPYLSIVEGKHIKHPALISEARSRMKILLLNPGEDIPIQTIKTILRESIALYKSGVIKIKN